MKKPLLISACLLGAPCRFDGKSVTRVRISELSDRYNLIPICPEIYGGLPTPRVPSERCGERVVMADGTDVTENFFVGAAVSVDFARGLGATAALLKERSPSCGHGAIYDGSFTHTLKEGDGVAAEALIRAGVRVYGECEIEKLLSEY